VGEFIGLSEEREVNLATRSAHSNCRTNAATFRRHQNVRLPNVPLA
jgi:hypothetical protein